VTTRIITLTHEPPVRIEQDNWPPVARATHRDAARTHTLYVRAHADGRKLVYGTHDVGGQREIAGGERLDPREDVAAAIRRVAQHIGAPESLAQACVASLPAQELV